MGRHEIFISLVSWCTPDFVFSDFLSIFCVLSSSGWWIMEARYMESMLFSFTIQQTPITSPSEAVTSSAWILDECGQIASCWCAVSAFLWLSQYEEGVATSMSTPYDWRYKEMKDGCHHDCNWRSVQWWTKDLVISHNWYSTRKVSCDFDMILTSPLQFYVANLFLFLLFCGSPVR